MSTRHAAAPSVDAQEVAYYEALAATWWDVEGPFWPLHRLNALRSDWLTARLRDAFSWCGTHGAPLAGLEVLDVGCGGGLLTEALARRGASVTGIDVVARNVAVARHHATQASLDVAYAVDSAEGLAASGRDFDVVLSMEVVEHVADLPGFLHACTTLVRPGGMLGLATINRTARSFLFAIVGAELVLRWLPRGTHRWRRFVRPAELDGLLRAGGLEPCDRSGVAVNPFSRAFSLTPSLAVNYMVLARR